MMVCPNGLNFDEAKDRISSWPPCFCFKIPPIPRKFTTPIKLRTPSLSTGGGALTMVSTFFGSESITLWNSEGAFLRPNGITLHSNNPIGVMNAVGALLFSHV
eukprot:GHVS01003511.1.p2 GENE.GHVS01003511.1~~GHVS01003511.1.p2  ORF type:complete len:103 (-),score=3.16 GHVS01003511.1:831-1139(-)